MRLLVSALALLWAMPARAEWWEARTDHFVVYSEGSAKEAKHLAETLERFDQSLRSLQSVKFDVPPSDSQRLTVFRFGNIDDIGRLAGSQGVAGFYIAALGGPVAFTPAKSERLDARSLYRVDRRTEMDPQGVLFHEYAHHFMFKHFTAAYPSWYVEGLAETYSTLTFKDHTSFHLGNPPQHRSDALFGSGWNYSVQRLLLNRSKPDFEDYYAWYTYGWLLTHYLTFEPDRAGQLQTYLQLINKGVDTAPAAKQAFGDLDRLDADVGRYKERGRKGDLPGVVVRPAGLHPPAAALRKLDVAEEAIMWTRMRSARGVSKKTAGGVAASSREVAAKYPASYAAQLALAEAELDAKRFEAAERATAAALAARPNSATALYYHGLSFLERAKSDPQHYATARRWFARANKADPHHPGPLVGNYRSYAEANAAIPESAIIGLERAHEMAPYDAKLRLMVVRQLLAEGKGDLSRSLLVPLALQPHESKRAKALDEVVALIDRGKLGEALVKLNARMVQDEKDEEEED